MPDLNCARIMTLILSTLILSGCTDPPGDLVIRENDFSRYWGPIERGRYHALLNEVIDGESRSFKKLIYFNCGGASRCYFHGENLVQVTYLIGEEAVLGLLTNLSEDDQKYLALLLSAGLEYGEFEGKDKGMLLKNEFPLLYEALPKLKGR